MNEKKLTKQLWDIIDNIEYHHAEMIESYTGIKLKINDEYFLISINKL